MKIKFNFGFSIETQKKKYEIQFTTGFQFCSYLTRAELKDLIRSYPVSGYKIKEEAEVV